MSGVPQTYNPAIAARRHEREADNDIVFVALTRPAMFWGTPIESFSFIPPFAMVAMIAGNNPLWAAVAAVTVFWGFRLLADWDPHFARRLRLAARTKGRGRNIRRWGGPSLSPRLAHRPLDPTHLFVQGWTELEEPPGLLARLAEAMERRSAHAAR